jgi:DNA-directed RNA polymerase specialized sigma24 family protein
VYNDSAAFLLRVAKRKFRLPEDDAREIVHEIFCRLLSGKYDVKNPVAWLMRCLVRECLARNKQRAREAPLTEEAADPTARVEARVLVQQVLPTLPARSRDVVHRVLSAGLPGPR